jgi:hypothetical protein
MQKLPVAILVLALFATPFGQILEKLNHATIAQIRDDSR